MVITCIDVRIALEDALAAAEYENVEPRLRKAAPDRADERRGEQDVAEPPQRDDQDARARGQIEVFVIATSGAADTSGQGRWSDSSRWNDL